MNLFLFSAFFKYKFAIAYAKAVPLMIYNPVFIGSSAICESNKAVGDVIIAVFISLVNNFNFLPYFLYSCPMLFVKLIFTLFEYFVLMGIPSLSFLTIY